MEGLKEPDEEQLPKPLIDKDDTPTTDTTDTNEPTPTPTTEYIPPDVSAYGQQYIDYNTVRGMGVDPYKPLTNCRPDDVSFTIDNKNAMSSRRRARDKRCKTAVVKKGSDYYRYHYADELKDSENRAWWGRHEY
jgi:hypothetical protein